MPRRPGFRVPANRLAAGHGRIGGMEWLIIAQGLGHFAKLSPEPGAAGPPTGVQKNWWCGALSSWPSYGSRFAGLRCRGGHDAGWRVFRRRRWRDVLQRRSNVARVDRADPRFGVIDTERDDHPLPVRMPGESDRVFDALMPPDKRSCHPAQPHRIVEPDKTMLVEALALTPQHFVHNGEPAALGDDCL